MENNKKQGVYRESLYFLLLQGETKLTVLKAAHGVPARPSGKSRLKVRLEGREVKKIR
jgi:hypothetical protein